MAVLISDWMALILLAAAVPAFAAAILIMFSRLFDSKHLDQAARTELVFAGSTVFLALALVIILPITEYLLLDVSNKMIYETMGPGAQPQKTLIDVVLVFMAPRLECMREIIAILYHASVFFEMASTTYIEVFMSEVSSGFMYKMFTERIINTTNAIAFYTYVYYLMVHILNFMKYAAMYLFLPIGLILRAFPPTRGAGAYVIAFSIGIYFIFPFTYIAMSALPMDYTEGWCNIEPLEAEPSPTSCGFMDQSKQKEAESWIKRHMNEVSGTLDKIQLGIFKKLTVSICLVPLMAMVVLLSFVLSTTSLFGGNIPEVGRGLVKLI